MTDKPDNQMERWLEEYARRRQGELGVPLDMHEATRTMLQGEVSRKYGQPAPSSKPEPTGIPWLGWALGGAAIGAVTLVITINSNQSNDPKPMAKVDPKPETGNVVTGESDNRDGGRFKKAEAKEAGENLGQARTSPRRPESVAVTSGHSAPGSPGVATVQALPGVGPAGFANPGRIVGRPNVVQPSAAFYTNLRQLRQEFSQADVKSANLKKPLPKPVLVNFQVERNGNQVRVIDGDGSEYTGTVINEEEFAAEATAAAAAPPNEIAGLTAPSSPKIAGAPAPTIAPALAMRRANALPIHAPRGQFYFRVSGTNKTLRKRVVIEATFDNPVAKLTAAKVAKAKAGESGQNKNRPQAGGAAKKEVKNRNIQAVRAIARMRVLGNARIEKANYPIDAYQRAAPAPAKPDVKPTEAKEK